MRPPNMPLWYKDCSELKACEKQQAKGEAFSAPPYLPDVRASKRSSIVLNPLLQRFTPQGDDSDQRQGDWKVVSQT